MKNSVHSMTTFVFVVAMVAMAFTSSWGVEAPTVDVALPDWEHWGDCDPSPSFVDETSSYTQEECAGGTAVRFRTMEGEVFMVGWGYDPTLPDPTRHVRFALRLEPAGTVWFIGGEQKRFQVRFDPSRPVIEFLLTADRGSLSPVREILLSPGNPGCPEFPGETT